MCWKNSCPKFSSEMEGEKDDIYEYGFPSRKIRSNAEKFRNFHQKRRRARWVFMIRSKQDDGTGMDGRTAQRNKWWQSSKVQSRQIFLIIRFELFRFVELIRDIISWFQWNYPRRKNLVSWISYTIYTNIRDSNTVIQKNNLHLKHFKLAKISNFLPKFHPKNSPKFQTSCQNLTVFWCFCPFFSKFR